ncbi:MAG: NifB/NifX family molybdenum-iron cluster-binding protein [Myxococcaceae bacterium]
MRIAIPVTDGQIPNHLGHCKSFLFVEVKDGKIESEQELPNPGHGPGGPPPAFVAGQGVQQVLAWGMPPHAQGMFAEMGIKVQLGATGEARQAVRDFLAGTLKTTDQALDAGGSCGHSGHDHDH